MAAPNPTDFAPLDNMDGFLNPEKTLVLVIHHSKHKACFHCYYNTPEVIC